MTFVVRNAGTVKHELVVLRTATKAAKLPVNDGGKASERGSVGRQLAAGATRRLTLTLTKGHYVLICNLGGHYMAGMRANLTVR